MKKTKKKLKTKSKMLLVMGCALVIIILVLTIGFQVKNYTDDRPYYFGVTDDISIRYAYSIGVPTVDVKNSQTDYMDVLTIPLEGKDLKNVKKLLKTYSFHLDKSRETVGVAGEYELIIGEEKLYLDQEIALYTKNDKDYYLIDVTTELYDLVSDITWNVLEKNFKVLNATDITVTGRERNTTFTDKERVTTLCNLFRFHEFKSNDDQISDPVYTLDFHNGTILTVHEGNIGTIQKDGVKKYIIFYTDPREDVRNLFEAKVEEDDEALMKAMYGD